MKELLANKKKLLFRIVSALVLGTIFTFLVNTINEVGDLFYVIKNIIYCLLLFWALGKPIARDPYLICCSAILGFFTAIGKASASLEEVDYIKTIIYTPFCSIAYYIFLNKLDGFNFKYKATKHSHLFNNFWFRFGFMLLAWLPYLLAFMPGIFQIDTSIGIRRLTTGGSFHDSIIYSVSIAALWAIMQRLNFSDSTFVFVATVINMLSFGFVLNMCIRELNKFLNEKQRMVTTLFFAFFPVFGLSAVHVCKDVIYSVVLVFFVIRSFLVFKGDKTTKKGLLFFVAFFLMLLRNNTIYFLGVWAVGLLLFKARRKYAIGILLMCLLFVGYKKAGEKIGVENDGFQESLSIPMQQMARVYYLRDYYSEDEKKLIDSIHEYDSWQYYYCEIADMAKHKLNRNVLSKEFINLYLKTGKDNFKDYVDAFVLLHRSAVYPDAVIKIYSNINYCIFEYTNAGFDIPDNLAEEIKGEQNYFQTNQQLGEPTPFLPYTRDFINFLCWHVCINYIPVYSKVFAISTYLYLYIIAIFFALKKKEYKVLTVLIPGLLMWGTLLLGPCVMVRYYFYYFYIAPFIVFYLIRPKENLSV